MIIGKSLTALGGGGLKPEIIVTAKAGALLNLYYKDSSIILQSYQLGESDTQHTFVVSVSETAYVVEDATNGKSVEVLVDAVAVFEAEIPYTLYLYRDGDECEAVTGEWTYAKFAASSSYNDYNFTKKSDRMLTRYYNDNSSLAAFTNNPINLSGYTKLCVEMDISACYRTYCSRFFGAATTKTMSNIKTVTGAVYQYGKSETGSTKSKEILNIDISSTDSLYVYAGICQGEGNVYKVWLE